MCLRWRPWSPPTTGRARSTCPRGSGWCAGMGTWSSTKSAPTVQEKHVDAKTMGEDLEKILLTEEQLQSRVTEMAAEIDADYAGREVLLVGILKGAVMVMADLSRRLNVDAQMDWMAVSS